MDFALSCILEAHSADVKDVIFISQDTLASCSRDKSVFIWDLLSKSPKTHLRSYTSYVNSLCSDTTDSNQPLVISAGADKDIFVHQVETGECLHRLVGHTDNVCVLASIPDAPHSFISGSWDKTARVWSNFECTFILKGHEQPVWGVLALSSTKFVTASADKSIKFWNQNQCIKTIPNAHSDVARALCFIPSQTRIASCSNDGTVKVWSDQGDFLYELHGHTSFVYKVACIPSTGELISCGEDRTIRVWKDGDLKQTLTLPVISVWSVTVSPTSLDIAAGGNDGRLYLFTRDPTRLADPSTLELYETRLSHFTIPKNQLGDLNKETLPGPEALLVPGKKDGHTIMVKSLTSSSVEAYQWSASELRWIKIGDVVDAIGSHRKQVFEGKEYDYVFEIDTGSGQYLKLPYNLIENPYDAAHRFLVKHDLDPTVFLEQVANFIINNTKGATISQGTVNEEMYVDPFTGANRYRASVQSSSTPSSSSSTVPKYNPWSNETTATTKPSSSSSNSSSSSSSTGVLPVQTFVTFQQFNFQAITKKLQDLATQYHLLNVDFSQLEASNCFKLAQLIFNHTAWPLQMKFPALDLLRCFVLTESTHSSDLMSFVLKTIDKENAEFNALMAFRVIANMFLLPSHRSSVLAQAHPILVQLNDYRVSTNKNVRLGIATVLLNLSIHMYQTNSMLPDAIDVLAILVEFLQHETDSETLYRTITAIGTLCYLKRPMQQYITPFNLKVFLNQILDKEKELRILQVAQECLNLM